MYVILNVNLNNFWHGPKNDKNKIFTQTSRKKMWKHIPLNISVRKFYFKNVN